MAEFCTPSYTGCLHPVAHHQGLWLCTHTYLHTETFGNDYKIGSRADAGICGWAHSYVATGVTSVVTSVTTAGGRVGWLPDNLNQGRLDLYYTVLVLLSAVNVLFFLVVAHSYQYKKVRRCAAGTLPFNFFNKISQDGRHVVLCYGSS